MGVGEAWRKVREYAEEVYASEGITSCYDIISADYVAAEKNQRVKMYARYSISTPALLIQHLTLNNRVHIPNIETYAQTIWETFFEHTDTLTGPNKINYYYDIRPNGKIGTSKVYVPVIRHYKNEEETARRVCSLLRAFGCVEGDEGFEVRYLGLVKNLYPYRDVSKRNGGHTHMGISFKSDGSPPELIQYFNAELYAPERTETGAPTIVRNSSDMWEWQKQFKTEEAARRSREGSAEPAR
ncbi:hypothetical protein HK097_000628 [Rhizophlyctis rosea]|uniref:Uncharacterized protein n=1 Tax=Rhizophlyctis rosea TaxID=64517 RepID=A0AAD5S894_9FUNG|nr:hypothetical protein HK097_000628 [Rhizophlyctis rosea]